MVKHLIFDFDGTIADSQEIVDEILGELAIKHSIDHLTPKEIKHISGLPFMKRLKLLIFIRKVDSEFKDRYRAKIKRIPPVEGIVDVLKRLDALGVGLSVISSNRSANIAQFFELHGLSFIGDIISAQGIFGKHKAIKRFRRKYAAEGQVLYIGDEIRDIKACQKAGVDIAFVTWGLDGGEELGGLKVKAVLTEPSELVGLIG